MKLWQDVPARCLREAHPRRAGQLFGEIRAEVSPELTGVGYIIGPRIAGFLFAGGCISFFVLIPAIKLFGAGLTTIIPPATKLIADMDAMTVRANYVYYIGAGAVTAAGLISLGRSLPTILAALVRGLKGAAAAKGDKKPDVRTERDLPIGVVAGGSLALVILMMVLPQIHPRCSRPCSPCSSPSSS